MTFTVDGKSYRIAFQYPHKHSRKRSRVKALIIERGENGNIVASGESKANLDAGDKFDLHEGRMLALTRALAGFNRTIRIAAWRGYYDRGVKG